MGSQCMRFILVSASVKTAFAFSLVWRQRMYFKCLFASVKKAFAFSLVLRHHACVSNACLHRLRRLLRFLGMVSQCMRFTHLFSSFTTTFAFSLYGVTCMCLTRLSASIRQSILGFAFFFVSLYNACVSHACLHR